MKKFRFWIRSKFRKSWKIFRKISISVQNFEKYRSKSISVQYFEISILKFWFRSKVLKISISVKILRKSRFRSKFRKISKLRSKFRKISISVQNFENIDFGQNFWKISISFPNFENFENLLDFKFRIRSKKIWFRIPKIFDFENRDIDFEKLIDFGRSKFSKNFEFGPKFPSWFRSKFCMNFNFDQNFRKSSISVQNFDFGPKFRKSISLLKFRKSSISVKIFRKSRFQFSPNFDFGRTFENLRFQSNFWFRSKFPMKFRIRSKIWKIRSKYSKKVRFRSKFSKNFNFGPKFGKYRFRSKFSKNFDFENRDIGQNFRKISISVKIYRSKFSKNFNFGPVQNFDFGQKLLRNRFRSKFSTI